MNTASAMVNQMVNTIFERCAYEPSRGVETGACGGGKFGGTDDVRSLSVNGLYLNVY
jgi:hypothetical protein